MAKKEGGDVLGKALKQIQDGDPEATEQVYKIATPPSQRSSAVCCLPGGIRETKTQLMSWCSGHSYECLRKSTSSTAARLPPRLTG